MKFLARLVNILVIDRVALDAIRRRLDIRNDAVELGGIGLAGGRPTAHQTAHRSAHIAERSFIFQIFLQHDRARRDEAMKENGFALQRVAEHNSVAVGYRRRTVGRKLFVSELLAGVCMDQAVMNKLSGNARIESIIYSR